MAFIGVRISWLMLARNIDFISVASSALRLARDELRRLGLELARLLLRLPEQLLGAEVALQDLQAHRDDGQQFVEQRLLPRGERPEGCHFEDAEQRVGGHRRHGRRLHRRRLAETGGNAQVVGREIRQRERSPFARALTDEALAERDDRRDAGNIRQAVGGDAPQLGRARRRARRSRPRRRRASARGPTGGAGRTPPARPRPAALPSRGTRWPSPSAVRPSPRRPA